jgi:hypothetical protein
MKVNANQDSLPAATNSPLSIGAFGAVGTYRAGSRVGGLCAMTSEGRWIFSGATR